jgi:hypothetical protein
MNVIRAIARSAAILAGLVAAALLAAIGAASAAFAADQPHPGAYPRHPFPFPPHAHAAVAGSTPGWQTALVVGGAVLLAAVIAIAGGLLERARAAQRPVTTTAA